MLSITLSEPSDLASVGAQWLELQARSACSFFQSWAWVGCLGAERYSDPVLLRAERDGRVVALALFNRRGSGLEPDSLWLGESGIAALDSVFVEHNGVLLARGAELLLGPCLRAVLEAPLGPGGRRFARRLVLSGVDERHVHAAAGGRGVVMRRQVARPAPYIDLTRLPAGESFLAGLSANTRYQIRRSDRRYAAMGAIAVVRAETLAQAHVFLDALAALHQATWTRRGHAGAFAAPEFLRFHRELIARALPRGEVDLLQVCVGGAPIGYLYNFCFDQRVATYQSGFDYAAAGQHQKPGLTCHHIAIEMYRQAGMRSYDFLAGADRYKLSLANAAVPLHWVELAPRWSVRAVLGFLRDLPQRWRG